MKIYRKLNPSDKIPRVNAGVSVVVAAALLNVERSTIVQWSNKGYLTAKRRYFSRPEGERYFEIEHLLEQAAKRGLPINDEILEPLIQSTPKTSTTETTNERP